MGIETIDPLVIREEQRSYETGVFILPLPTTWQHTGQVLLQTPARNYTVGDYAQFFDDIEFSEGLDMMENIVDYVNLTSPGVRTVCVFSLGVQTPVKLIYQVRPGLAHCRSHYSFKENFPDAQPDRLMGDGDGTVTKYSLEACQHFLTQNDKVKTFQNINHADVLKNTQIFDFIKSIIVG